MRTHLHVRSCYTLLNSTLKINDIITHAVHHQLESVALVDKGTMHGAIPFFRACKEAGIRPIFGIEVTISVDDENMSLIVYAKNNEGYKKLLLLSTRINTSIVPLTLEELSSFDQDVIITTSGDNDGFQSLLVNESLEGLTRIISMCKHTFTHFFVAVSMNDSGLLKIRNSVLQEICDKEDVKCFALSRIYYGEQEDEEAYKTLCAIDQQKFIDDPNLTYSSKRYFRSMEEMKLLYTRETLEQAQYIAEQCHVTMEFEKATLPVFSNKYGVDSNTYLRSLCKKGLEKRLTSSITDKYVNRLTYEIDVIISMGFADYFLIVYDFIRFAKSKGIYVGPGRGSAAGSLVSYCLGITHVDPLEYDLLFERFLNPERISMPDIDIDFPDDRRDEVIAYVRELYGKERVAHIVTFGTLGAKQVLRDVGRVMKFATREIDMLSKMIPSVPKITLGYVLETNGRFKQTVHASQRFEHLIEVCRRIEGIPRHASTHAAGVVLSHTPIQEFCPLIQVEADMYSTQYTMEYLEELGLIKMDFLGLRNLTIIDEVCQHIGDNMNQSLDIMRIPLNDPKTFSIVQEADTMGVFQLESEGMKNLIRQMRPINFEEIAATIALYRPGPMENIPLYLDNREHPEDVDYMHPSLEGILKKTYGVMIYQEQIMQVTQVMANFSLGKADVLRKAISKKKSDQLVSLRSEFIEASMKNGYEEALAKKVYDMIMKFAGYGFNRAHSIAYALIAYQLAYLKANYPISFFSSVLNSVIGGERKTSEYIFEAKKRNIKVLHPCINGSAFKYEVEGDALRFPYINIKNVGSAAAQEINAECTEGGPFLDFFDFIARISTRRISRKVIESLIDAGALDSFLLGRAAMKDSLDDALRYASLVRVEEGSQIRIDLDLVSKPALSTMHENHSLRSEYEKNALGFYLSTHPITKVRAQYPKAQLLIELRERKGHAALVCYIDRIKEHRTKNGDMMAFLSVSDESDKFDVVCMPNIFRTMGTLLKKGVYLYIEGKIDKPQSMLANRIVYIEDKQ